MSRQPNSTVASARPKRTPISSRNRLSVRNKEDGYVYRFVNTNLENDPERIEAFLEQGYEIVPKDKAGQIGDKRVDNASSLGSSSLVSVGQGTKAVLMRIPKELYQEDQSYKQAEINATEQTMHRSSDPNGYGSVEIK